MNFIKKSCSRKYIETEIIERLLCLTVNKIVNSV